MVIQRAQNLVGCHNRRIRGWTEPSTESNEQQPRFEMKPAIIWQTMPWWLHLLGKWNVLMNPLSDWDSNKERFLSFSKLNKMQKDVKVATILSLLGLKTMRYSKVNDTRVARSEVAPRANRRIAPPFVTKTLRDSQEVEISRKGATRKPNNLRVSRTTEKALSNLQVWS